MGQGYLLSHFLHISQKKCTIGVVNGKKRLPLLNKCDNSTTKTFFNTNLL